ncbi:diol dehydratase reactivase ATPase-like domain-containing protein [Cryptosporangium phraense]|uniref:Diol dehydratase reactivase n=1 Tax=Cryptosporangium phraense TaxID=2593070 RepID=A0A545AQH2_9ACTN|nr:diol dehydratase reactivase ATPase-like domain-containing protein [Cryptosporangium phraense]TQS43569.1 diol dehydratase reactivase [Cryptosporangium phraense]
MSLRVVAGVDVGNATTEVVLASVATGEPVAWDRTMTRGVKGSPSSVQGAAALVRRLVRRVGGELVGAAVAPLRPVRVSAGVVRAAPVDTGRFAVVAAGVSSPGGSGVGVGRPVPLETLARVAGPLAGGPPVGGSVAGGSVVVLVAGGYREAVPRLRELISAGAPIVGVLLAADEARLVANRLGAPVPVVDGVDLSEVASASAVAVEVAEAGRPLRRLTDPLFLAGALSAGASETAALRRVARRVADVSSAVVAALPVAPPVVSTPSSLIRTPSGDVSLADAARRDVDAIAYVLEGAEPVDVDDLAVVDVGALASSLLVRAGAGESGFVLAGLLPSGGPVPASELLAEALGVPVRCAPSEASAALRGALTTPGAPPDAVVLDLGGGTVDVVGAGVGPGEAGGGAGVAGGGAGVGGGLAEGGVDGGRGGVGGAGGGAVGERVMAGGGDLLTAAVALGLGVTRGVAEWAKRGPAVRVETPQLATQEDGDKTFLPAPQPPGTVGWLAAPGPAGLLPVTVRIGPAEWRSFRLSLKQAVLGTAVRRGLAGASGGTVLVVGGPAGDDEVLRVVDAVLPDGVGLGRGNVAGRLGHRYAVAWGLALSAAPR